MNIKTKRDQALVKNIIKYYKGKLIFEGEYKDGLQNGYGKKYEEGKLTFEGKFLNGKEWEGKGRVEEFHKGLDFWVTCYYYGEFSEGKLNGEGKKIKKVSEEKFLIESFFPTR